MRKSRELNWPLLGKELVERAARRQTYLARVAYAALLLGLLALAYRHLGPFGSGGGMFVLGQGEEMFRLLMGIQFAGIYLFVPPLMADAFTREKERDTLSLLFLTDLTDGELVLQKFVAGLMPMLTFLLMALPLMAAAYSLGGVSAPELVCGAILLLLACLHLGALALLCSARSSTATQALIRCYVYLPLMLVLSCLMLFPPYVFFSQQGSGGGMLVGTVMSLLTIGGLVIVTLVWTRRSVHAYAFVPRRNPVRRQFKMIDQFSRDLRRLLRALVGRQATVMRETGGRETLNRLLRLEVPALVLWSVIFGWIVIVVLGLSDGSRDRDSHLLPGLMWVVWLIAVVSVPVITANAVVAERLEQRLDVLLATPLTAREILQELTRPALRWVRYLGMVLCILAVTEAWHRYAPPVGLNWRTAIPLLYLVGTGLTVVIFLLSLFWLALWIGLRIRKQSRALLLALCVSLVWWWGASGVDRFTRDDYGESGGLARALALVSPDQIMHALQFAEEPFSVADWMWWLCGVVVSAVALLGLRAWCLRKADQYLGRV